MRPVEILPIRVVQIEHVPSMACGEVVAASYKLGVIILCHRSNSIARSSSELDTCLLYELTPNGVSDAWKAGYGLVDCALERFGVPDGHLERELHS